MVMPPLLKRRLVRPGTITTAAIRSVVALPPLAARTPLSMFTVIGVSSVGMLSAAEWMNADSFSLS